MQYEFPLSNSSFAFVYFYCSWPASISFATCGARSVINNVSSNVIEWPCLVLSSIYSIKHSGTCLLNFYGHCYGVYLRNNLLMKCFLYKLQRTWEESKNLNHLGNQAVKMVSCLQNNKDVSSSL